MIISIDGNIACGKTTVVERLKKEFTNYRFYPEKIKEWNEYLEDFYKNNNNAVMLEIKCLLDFYNMSENMKIGDINVIERSPVSVYNVFATNMYENNLISPLNFKTFTELYDILSWKPDITIYIRTIPEISFDRKICRAREAEDNVTLEYIRTIHEKYEKVFNKTNSYIVDGNQDQESVYKNVYAILHDQIL